MLAGVRPGRANRYLMLLVVTSLATLLNLSPTAVHKFETARSERTTYLDSIKLKVDGRFYSPRSCSLKDESWCTSDNDSLIIPPGRTHSFLFDIPIDAKSIEVFADGYSTSEP